jgi:hypothetical protein
VKKLRQILTFVVAFCMMFQCSLLSVFADDEYTYTVTFYAGNQGTFADGAGKIVMSNLKYGAFVSFDVQKDGVVTLNNSDKYYVKGLRKSGRDNSETDELEASRYSVTVKGDADYVVAYGIKGNQVAYTVNYQDVDGKELLASNTYYGNVGDKPVVAYQYVEGYTPQALALTKTLSENSAENVFTFRYTPIGTTVVTIPGETTTVTTVVPGTTNVETITVPATTSAGTTTGTTGTGTTGTGTTGTGTTGTGTTGTGTTGTGAGTTTETGTGTDAGTTTDTDAGTAGTTETDTTTDTDAGIDSNQDTQTIEEDQTPQGTQEIQDLDEDETPLSRDADIDQGKVKKGFPVAAGIAIGICGVAVLAGMGVLLKKYMAKKK